MAGKLAGFEKDMRQLDSILEQLSGDEVDLDESVRLYAEAATLIERCNQRLGTAQVEIEEIDSKLQKLRDDDEL